MLKLIPPILIFLSLGVIVFIVGRHASQVRESKGRLAGDAGLGGNSSGKFKNFILLIAGGLKGFAIFLAEWIVRKIKKFLHLIHFSLLKLKKGKNADEKVDLEVSRELFDQEKRNLEDIVSGGLERQESEFGEYSKDNVSHIEPFLKQEFEQQDRADKIGEFFLENEPEPEIEKEKNQGFFSRFLKRDKKESAEDLSFGNDYDPKTENFEEDLIAEDSDILAIRKKPATVEAENRLMSEVVTRKKRTEEADMDEDIGIDRQILEKKIIQKITRDPKNIENYRQLGDLYIKMKNFHDAEESFRQILKMAPRDIDSKRKLEKIKLLKRLK